MPNEFVDASVFATSSVTIGTFRCPVSHQSFRDTGPIERCIVVFPRTAVWIRHAGSRAFLADPSVATIYNAAQRYERFPESPEGDRCEWFSVSGDVAREIVREFDVGAAESDRPFRFEWAECPAALYVRQRALVRRAVTRNLERLEGEEQVVRIVAAVIARAYRGTPSHRTSKSATAARHRDLVDAARAELLRSVSSNVSIADIAAAVGTSPYHLCRVFRACTGRTLHHHRTELRIRLALERLEAPASSHNLSAIAHDLGFSSHSHFVRAMRRHAGAPPSAVRGLICGHGLATTGQERIGRCPGT